MMGQYIIEPEPSGSLLTRKEAEEMADRISKRIVENINKQMQEALEAVTG